MTDARALAIIAACGADPARWPADERAAVLARTAQPAVATALREAAALDALLGDWAGVEVASTPFDAAASIPAPRMVPAPRRRWWAAGALAAAVAAAVVLTPMPAPPRVQTVSQTPVASATGTSEAGDDAAFAYVFTPTVDEDALI